MPTVTIDTDERGLTALIIFRDLVHGNAPTVCKLVKYLYDIDSFDIRHKAFDVDGKRFFATFAVEDGQVVARVTICDSLDTSTEFLLKMYNVLCDLLSESIRPYMQVFEVIGTLSKAGLLDGSQHPSWCG